MAGGGQTGVRGPLIRREGDLVAKSFAAGFISGFGDVLSSSIEAQVQANNANNFASALSDNPTNNTTNNPTNSDVLRRSGLGGAASGVGSAGELLANYFIARAEQYQPVVSLRAGTSVEVVFLVTAPFGLLFFVFGARKIAGLIGSGTARTVATGEQPKAAPATAPRSSRY